MSFFDRNKDTLVEDVRGDRDATMRASKMDGTTRIRNAARIEVDRIEADSQHREDFDEEALNNLAASIREHGQLQPIRVRWEEGRSKYVIIAGERRWRACQVAGITAVDCVIADRDLSDSEILREQIIENAIREDLKPTERAKAFRDLMKSEGWNQKQLGAEIHISTSTVSRAMQLLKLPEETQQLVDDGKLTEKEALALPAAKQGSEEAAEPTASRKRKPKPGRERKIVVSGYTITIKARRLLDDERSLEALEAAMSELGRAA